MAMTDHDERERLAAWLEHSSGYMSTTLQQKDYLDAARLLREPVNARLLAAAKDARQYMLDGCPAPVSMGEPILKELRLAIAAAQKGLDEVQ